MADNYNKRSPDSTIQPEYYYTQAEETIGGHTFIVHNKPGEEALRMAHTKGTYVEIDKAGGMQLKVVGKSHYYMADGFSHVVEGHADLKVQGTYNFNVDQSYSEAIGKNKYVGIGGDYTHSVDGTRTTYAKKNRFDSVDGKEVTRVTGRSSQSFGGEAVRKYEKSLNETITNDMGIKVGGDIEFQANGLIRFVCKNFEIEAETVTIKTSTGSLIVVSGADITVTANGNVNTQSGGTTSINSSSDIITQGSSTKIQGGGSVGPPRTFI